MIVLLVGVVLGAETINKYFLKAPDGTVIDTTDANRKDILEKYGYQLTKTETIEMKQPEITHQATVSINGHSITLKGPYEKLKDDVIGLGGTESDIKKIPEYKAKNAKLGTPINRITDADIYDGATEGNLKFTVKNGVITGIENTKTHTTRELKEGIEITSVKDGPITLKSGDDVVTIPNPKESKITSKDITKDTFNALNALNKEMGGNLGKVTLNENYAQTGNTRAYAYTSDGKPATAVQTLIDPKKGTWSKMEVHRQVDGKDEYIKYEGCADCVGLRVGYVHGTSYTAEGRASNNLHTKWIERKIDKIHTRTNMEWDSEKDMYKITSFGPENYPFYPEDVYAETGFWGTINLYQEVDGKLVEFVYDVETQVFKKQLDQMKIDMRKAQHGSDWNWFGDILDKFKSATAGYTGVSLLYDEPDPIIDLDQTMSSLLGGIDAWTSYICQDEMTGSMDTGSAFSSNIQGAYAHVEGERITSMNHTVDPPEPSYLYKVSMAVDPGTEYRGCNIRFSIMLQGSGGTVYVAEDNGSIFISSSPYTFEAKKGESAVSYSGSNMLFFQDTRKFDTVCIHFEDILPEFFPGGEGCLIGVVKGESICNNLGDSGLHGYRAKEDLCDGAIMYFNPLCWG